MSYTGAAMNVETKPVEDVVTIVAALGRRAKAAAAALRNAATEAKNRALVEAARLIRAEKAAILAANARDIEAARAAGMRSALQDRLLLNEARIEGMAKGLDDIVALPDPVGAEIERWQRPNGLAISRVRVPIGVIGVIYEARPNVTADAGALCIKSGNVVVLRGGSDSFHSSRSIVELLRRALETAGLPEDCVQLVPTTDRAAVGELLKAMDWLDLIVPRGGRSLIDRVTQESRVPVLRHYDGICHVYVDRDADAGMARDLVANAKMRRVSVCGAAETLLIDRAALDTHLGPVLARLHELGCEVRGDAEVRKRDAKALPATEKDWRTEYLEPIISVATVDGVAGAIRHIATYGSQHTEAIVTDNQATADRFLKEVDSAIVMHNASTQFADGGEFGLGAEIGISTNRMHARGPVGLVELTTYKNVVRGKGTLRP
ncbi:glutamate-5-semialdehyde dehydrogenase [Enhydrobacter sp.]|jgi:glutamate-5-semialdehyde dehydrogenase|uniref:glutamate-5-semialdehyde dehydrogenase n=1 Tax=Enhydrobacter sp. TaxID=1894999 RepID=UPI00261F20F5|nr:glutamate-5-semialdehyde dehydrogenase [Enhydrobacter sp.]WIM12045.1 MAG: Gamma-glutamyl phosphate reductase [Enhydrobacter sp.]